MANIIINDEDYIKKYGKPITYYMDGKLKERIDTTIIPALKEDDEDRIILVDGNEGAGKSWFGFQLGRYIDKTLNLKRVCFNPADFREAILKADKGQVVIYDEAFTGLSSRSSLSAVNRVLVSLMMQMRQKNLCVIIILPTFFLLDKYAGIFRSIILIHIYKNSGVRGYFRVYNRKLKRLLYLFGSKTYNYSPIIGKKKRLFTRFKGRFYNNFALGDKEVEKEYRSLKMKALEATEKDPMTSSSVKYREQRDIMIYLIRKNLKLSYRKMESLLADYDFDISYRQIRSICAKFGDKEAKEEENIEKVDDSDEFEEESEKKDDNEKDNGQNSTPLIKK